MTGWQFKIGHRNALTKSQTMFSGGALWTNPRFPPDRLQHLQAGPSRGVLVQVPRDMPVVRGPTDGGYSSPPGGPRHSGCAGPPMGAVAAPSSALSNRL